MKIGTPRYPKYRELRCWIDESQQGCKESHFNAHAQGTEQKKEKDARGNMDKNIGKVIPPGVKAEQVVLQQTRKLVDRTPEIGIDASWEQTFKEIISEVAIGKGMDMSEVVPNETAGHHGQVDYEPQYYQETYRISLVLIPPEVRLDVHEVPGKDLKRL